MKKCSRCAELKPLVSFSKKHDTRDGHASYCKVCSSEFRKAWVEARPGYVKAYNSEYHRRNREALLLKDRADYAARREEMRAQAKARYARQPEVMRARRRAYYAENRDACIAVVKAWREENQAAWYAGWAAKNRAYLRAKANKRRAAELRAVPSWADAKLIEDFYVTADALNMWTGEWHHVDHIVPLQGKTVCGLHSHHNLQVLPAVENLRKRHLHWPDQP